LKRFRKGQWVVYKGRVGIHLGRRASGEAIGAVIFADGRQMQNVVTLGNTTEIHLVNVEGVTERRYCFLVLKLWRKYTLRALRKFLTLDE